MQTHTNTTQAILMIEGTETWTVYTLLELVMWRVLNTKIHTCIILIYVLSAGSEKVYMRI